MIPSNPLDIFREFDPKISNTGITFRGLTYAEDTLNAKNKLLITMTIDASAGAVQGAIVLDQRTMKIGASKEEIVEALRVAYGIGGNQALFTSASILQEPIPAEYTDTALTSPFLRAENFIELYSAK